MTTRARSIALLMPFLILSAHPGARCQDTVRGRTCFAWMSDLHVAPGTASETALRSCIRDINSLVGSSSSPEFVIVSGDLTNFGSDVQIVRVKEMLDSLEVPHYSIPGNHDAKWSESGCNTFGKVFDGESFDIHAGGFRIVGCASGPDMRMTPALIPRQHVRWLEEMAAGESEPTIFVNHFPLDSSVLNYGEVWQLMRSLDTRVALGGHWHRNLSLDYDGIPGVLCRSTLATRSAPAGYDLVTIEDGLMKVFERRPDEGSSELWYERDLNVVEPARMGYDRGLADNYPWMRYDVNDAYPQVREIWRLAEDANIAAGFACDGRRRLWYVTETGILKCVALKDGRTVWTAQLPGKAFSTPVLARGKVMLGCADGGMYAFSARNGRLRWVSKTEKSVLASPVVMGGRLYFGSSDGSFRAVRLRDGAPVWSYDGVGGFVECRAYADRDQIVFGAWDKCLYSLDPQDGTLQWKWEVPKPSEMYSPAACWPVKAAGKIFVAVPDRKVYALDCKTGEQVGVADGGREAIGLSEDGRTVFAKTMFHKLYALDAAAVADSAGVLPKKWEVESMLGYEIAPTALVEHDGLLIVPTDKGNILAYSSEDGSVVWAHKISPALVNPVTIAGSRRGETLLLASTLDGVVVLLGW